MSRDHRVIGISVTVGGQRVGQVIDYAPREPSGMLPIRVRMDDGRELVACIQWPTPIRFPDDLGAP